MNGKRLAWYLRWFRPRISLRVFLVLLTLFCLLLGTWVQRSLRQQRLVDLIYEQGGSVRYRRMFHEDTFSDSERFPPTAPPWPVTGPTRPVRLEPFQELHLWERHFPDFCCPVVEVVLSESSPLEDEYCDLLARLAPFTQLRFLQVGGMRSAISDRTLEALRPFKKLTHLRLVGGLLHPEPPELGPGVAVLRDLPKLETLHLGWSPLSPRGLTHLKECHQLKHLEWGARSERQKQEIETALPKCFYYDP